MKYKDFNFEMDREGNTVTLYLDPNDNYITIFSVTDAHINEKRTSLDEVAKYLRAFNDHAPDAQLTIVHLFDSTVKVVLTARTNCDVINFEFWGKNLEYCID